MRESLVVRVRRCGRSRNRQVRDRETGMRLPKEVDSRDSVRHIERNEIS